MIEHFADRTLAAIREKNAPVCVGFDPLIDRLPQEMLRAAHVDLDRGEPSDGQAAEAILAFGEEVIELVAPRVAIIKINIAFFERYRTAGVAAYHELVNRAARAGLIVIGDVKRADIGHTSMQYAIGSLVEDASGDRTPPDAVTVNPYFGIDGVRPFIDVARERSRGVFVLVQTSNASAATVQGLALADGGTVGDHVARMVQGWAAEDGSLGSSGYSCVGAVVSPRDLEATDRVRALMPNCLFLVPGFGAQGRTPEEVARCFKPDGTGAIVAASRSVIFAYHDAKRRDARASNWRTCIEDACDEMVQQVREVLGA